MGQDQELLNLRKYKFDLILLWFTPENDIWNNAFPTHWPLNGAGKPTIVLDKNGQLELASREDITTRLLYSDYKLYTLLLRSINSALTFLAGNSADAIMDP